MNTQEAIQHHRQICDELYELALEENRFLQQNRRLPEAELLERKRAAMGRLDGAITALRASSTEGSRDPQRRAALEKTQARIMQILQIDRENEQLMMRYSLTRGTPQEQAPSDAGLLQKIYSRGS